MEIDKKVLLSNIIALKNLKCLELSVSETCNYNCSYCTFWRNFHNRKKKLLMDVELAKLAVADFLTITNGRKDALIYFGTAEPLLNWYVVKEIILFSRSLDSKVKLNLITNGSLLDLEKIIFFKNNNINLGISLDGKEDTQTKQRIYHRKNVNSFKVVMDSLRLAKENGYNFSCLSGTYRNMEIKEDIEFLISLCDEYQIKELDIDFDVDSLTTIDDLHRLSNIMLEGYLLAKEKGLDVFGYWLIPYYNMINEDIANKAFCGNAIGESICISSDGKFKLCGYDDCSIVEYTSLSDMFKTIEVVETYRKLVYQKRDVCKNCVLIDACCGQCILNKKTSQKFNLTCEFYKIVTDKLVKAPA